MRVGVDTRLKGAVLICILKPNAAQGVLSIYNCAIYVLFYASPCQEGTTNPAPYDCDLRVIFVYDVPPTWPRHRSIINSSVQ